MVQARFMSTLRRSANVSSVVLRLMGGDAATARQAFIDMVTVRTSAFGAAQQVMAMGAATALQRSTKNSAVLHSTHHLVK